MVGDGINDAPVCSSGYRNRNGQWQRCRDRKCANDAAQPITTIREQCDRAVSSDRRENMKQNLFGAFIYNSLGIPIAAGVLYPFFGFLSALLLRELLWRCRQLR